MMNRCLRHQSSRLWFMEAPPGHESFFMSGYTPLYASIATVKGVSPAVSFASTVALSLSLVVNMPLRYKPVTLTL